MVYGGVLGLAQESADSKCRVVMKEETKPVCETKYKKVCEIAWKDGCIEKALDLGCFDVPKGVKCIAKQVCESSIPVEKDKRDKRSPTLDKVKFEFGRYKRSPREAILQAFEFKRNKKSPKVEKLSTTYEIISEVDPTGLLDVLDLQTTLQRQIDSTFDEDDPEEPRRKKRSPNLDKLKYVKTAKQQKILFGKRSVDVSELEDNPEELLRSKRSPKLDKLKYVNAAKQQKIKFGKRSVDLSNPEDDHDELQRNKRSPKLDKIKYVKFGKRSVDVSNLNYEPGELRRNKRSLKVNREDDLDEFRRSKRSLNLALNLGQLKYAKLFWKRSVDDSGPEDVYIKESLHNPAEVPVDVKRMSDEELRDMVILVYQHEEKNIKLEEKPIEVSKLSDNELKEMTEILVKHEEKEMSEGGEILCKWIEECSTGVKVSFNKVCDKVICEKVKEEICREEPIESCKPVKTKVAHRDCD